MHGQMWGLFFIFLLVGCVPDIKRDLATCELEATRQYPNERSSDHAPSSRYIVTCMQSKGYALSPKKAVGCDLRLPISTQLACYANDGWFQRLLAEK